MEECFRSENETDFIQNALNLSPMNSLTVWRLTTHIWVYRTVNLQTYHFIYLFNKYRYWIFWTCSILSVFFSSICSCFIMLTCLVPVLFTFYIQVVLKFKKNNSVAKGLNLIIFSFHFLLSYTFLFPTFLSFFQVSCCLVTFICCIYLYSSGHFLHWYIPFRPGWGCLRIGCWGEYLGLRGTMWKGSGENYIMKSLMFCTAQPTSLGW